MDYLVDVIVPTYNQERYIGATIESIVTQKTNFPFRLFIGDDCSKDNTRAIISEYAAKYPHIVFPIFHPRNLGAVGNGYVLLSSLRSKYAAVCDGDDYWTDPYKLQKQVDFLEANPEFTMCFTDVEIIDELGSDIEHLIPENIFPKLTKDDFTIEDFVMADKNIVPTPTMMFRNVLPQPIPEFYKTILSGDLFMQLMVTDKGKAKHLPIKTAIYRNHGTSITKSKESIAKGEEALIRLYHYMDSYLGLRHHALFNKKLHEMAKVNLVFGAKNKKGFSRITHYFQVMPDYVKTSEKINLKELIYYHMILFFPFLLPKGKG